MLDFFYNMLQLENILLKLMDILLSRQIMQLDALGDIFIPCAYGIHQAFKLVSSSYLHNAGCGFARSGGLLGDLKNLHLSAMKWRGDVWCCLGILSCLSCPTDLMTREIKYCGYRVA